MKNVRVVEWRTGIDTQIWKLSFLRGSQGQLKKKMQACPSSGHHFVPLVDREQIRFA